MNSKIMNIGHKVGVTFVALMVLATPFAPAQAADFSSSYESTYSPSYSSTYTPSSSSYESTYTPSYSSSYESTYTPSYESTYTPSYESTYTPSYESTYTPSTGCTTNCGGGGGGCTHNCGGGGCTHDCQPKPAPTCELSISPSRIEYGDSVTVSWDTTNAISAFLSGYGTVSVDGSRESGAIYGTKTFTLTATASSGKSVTCSKTVTVEREHEKNLDCELRASDTRIERGDSVRITWDSEGADYGYISPDIGDVDDSGSDTVRPRNDTTYKGTFYNNDGDKVTCSVKVRVEDDYTPLPNPTPYVNLSAVPYTGLDLGPVGTAIYWSFLIAWCLLAAYLIAVKRVHMSVYRWYKKALFGQDVHVAPSQAAFAGFSQHELSKLAEMLRGAVSHDHKPAAQAAAPVEHADAVDPFILSQIHRSKRS
jgi:hypothetical protein